MGRKVPPGDIDKAVQLYISGQSLKEASGVVGINSKTLGSALRKLGVPPGRRVIEIPTAVSEYLAGDSVLAIAKRHGVERGVIDRHLRNAEVEKRTASEQNRIAASRETSAQRKARANRAHAAKRGRPNSREALARAAVARAAKGVPESPGESLMLTWLKERGETPVIQAPVERYNIDLAIDPVAVEVLGGEWHHYRASHAIRTKVLLNAGWHVLFVWDTALFPIGSRAADYAVTFAKNIRRHPSAIREYRVIRGDGQFVAGGGAENYDLTRIPTARHGMSPSEAGRLGAEARWG